MDSRDSDSLAKAYVLNEAVLGCYTLYINDAKSKPNNNIDGFTNDMLGSFRNRGRSDRDHGGGHGHDRGQAANLDDEVEGVTDAIKVSLCL